MSSSTTTNTAAATVAATTAANNAKNNPVRMSSASSESPKSDSQPMSPPTNQRAANIRWVVWNVVFYKYIFFTITQSAKIVA